MDSGESPEPPDVQTRAEAVRTVAELARVLRALRRREARQRHGRELTYQQVADQTGWSVTAVGEYLTGAKLASTERFDELVRLLGASPHEQGVLATARERAADASRPRPVAVLDEVPRMLPARVRGFTGRLADLARLDDVVVAGGDGGTVLVTGMAGVGKTALAVHWAHGLADRFAGGQLYVNLRGYDAAEPVSTMDALGALIGGLGVVAADLPTDLVTRSELYRRLLAQRPTLVLLDNASGVDQVRPLLPPAPSLAVVTSRDNLTDLDTSDRAHRVALDVLAEDEAVALVCLLVGERARREPEAVRALVSRCGRLPLALRVAAEHAAFRSTVALADLVREMSEAFTLNVFDAAGDARADIRTVFSWSLRHLPEPAATLFRLVGLVPGNTIDLYGLAALAGVDLAEAQRLADRLGRAHLLESDRQGRFSMHDLLRAFAVESAEDEGDSRDRPVALTRLLDHYLTTATMAVDVQFPFAKPVRPRNRPVLAWDGPTPDVGTVAKAAEWLNVEHDNLVRACLQAARRDWPAHAVALATVLRPFLDNGHDHDGAAVHSEALAAAQRLGPDCDPFDHAFLGYCLSVASCRLGRLDLAADLAQRALTESTELGSAEGINLSLIALSFVRDSQGRYHEAVECKRRGLEIARAAGNRVQEATQLHNLGWVHVRLEEFEAAADFYRQAADINQLAGQRLSLAENRSGLATAYAGLGRFDEALDLAEKALAVEVEYARLMQSAELMMTVGVIYGELGRSSDAVEQLTAALGVAQDAGDAATTAAVLNALGHSYNDAGDYARAKERLDEALALAKRAGERFEQTRALDGLGDAYAGLGELALARHTWRQARDAYAEMGIPAADRVGAKLPE